MKKIIKPGDPEPVNLAPDSIYYELYDRLIAAYHQWGRDYLEGGVYLVQIEKMQIKVSEANNNILAQLEKDFTVQGDNKGEKKDGEIIGPN